MSLACCLGYRLQLIDHRPSFLMIGTFIYFVDVGFVSVGMLFFFLCTVEDVIQFHFVDSIYTKHFQIMFDYKKEQVQRFKQLYARYLVL